MKGNKMLDIVFIKNLFKSKEIRLLLENFTSLSVIQIMSYILPLITLPYLVRVVGVEKYGLITFAIAVMNFFRILTDYGFNLSANRDISVHRDDQSKISEIFSSVMIIKIFLMIISFLILLIIVNFDPFKENRIIYILSFGIVLGNVLFTPWFFQGMEKMKYITILNIVSNIIFTALIFVVVRNQSDYLYVPFINSIGPIFIGCISLRIIIKEFKVQLSNPGFNSLKKTFKGSTEFFLSRASVTIYTSSNAFFLGIFTDNVLVGYYSAAEKLYIAAQNLYQPIIQTLYPFMANKKDKILYKKIFWFVIVINICLCIFLFFYSDYIIQILFGKGFQESIEVFKIFMITLLVVVPSILLGFPFLAALGYQKYANVSVIIGSLFHLIAVIIILNFYPNIYLVALLVLITETIVLLIRVYGVKHNALWN